MLLLSNCHRIIIVLMLQKNCVIPKNEEVGMGNRDVKNRIDRVLVWAEYTVVCHKISVSFSSQKHFLYIL